MAVLTGKLSGFYQELMLRITSAEERLVQDEEIKWYERTRLLENKSSFNFYVTSDFATSAKQTADDSSIAVWALNHNGDWFWVDGICCKQTMDKTIDDLFRLCQEYRPMGVGIEVSGQQGGFVKWVEREMMNRNIWFTLASSGNGNAPGIRPATDKLSRFNLVVPWFKMGKMYFPEEMRNSTIIGKYMTQISLATRSGIKGKDDCLDTTSMLGYLSTWRPSESAAATPDEIEIWDNDEQAQNTTALSSYIV